MSMSALSQRTTSAFPISIGSSLALESCFKGPLDSYDPQYAAPNKIDVLQYQYVLINVGTICRNIYSAVRSTEQSSLKARDVSEVIEMECSLIKEAFQNNSPNTKVLFYGCHYAGLKRHYPHAVFRQTSLKTQEYDALAKDAIGKYLQLFTPQERLLFDLNIDLHLKGSKVLIFTHMPHDLLLYKNCTQLDLLESHTGKLKDRTKWFTKFAKSTANIGIERIPFNHVFLQVFGDNQLFSSFPVPARQHVLKMAEQFKWNALITMSRVRTGIETIPDGFLRSILLEML